MSQVIPWQNCPNCDHPLYKKVFIGDGWYCAECGEGGIREPGKYDRMYRSSRIWPEKENDNDNGDVVANDDPPF